MARLSEQEKQEIPRYRHRAERRFAGITNAEDFLATDEGVDRLDAIAMILITIGESLKNLDKPRVTRS